MNRAAKIATWSAVALVVAGLAVGAGYAVSTVASAFPQAPTPAARTPEPSATPDPEQTAIWPKTEQERVGGAENCHPHARIDLSSSAGADGTLTEHAELRTEPIDFGPREGAHGVVNLNPRGQIDSYTTVLGDNLVGIELRLCTDMDSVARYNGVGYAPGEHTWKIGDTFVIRPDPNVPWVDPVRQWREDHRDG